MLHNSDIVIINNNELFNLYIIKDKTIFISHH